MGLKGVKKRVMRQNMIDFHYDKKFDVIFIPARSFLHLKEQKNQISCLKNIKKHLKDNGIFVLIFFNPDLEKLINYSSRKFSYIDSFNHPNQDKTIKLFSRQQNDIKNQIQNIEWKFEIDNSEYIIRMDVRWIYKEEFKLLLKIAGFSGWKLYGDFDKSKFKNSSSEIIWVVNK
ncbi:MAG: hypothetical protein FXF47_08400 [Candidatus Mcinerneyibacterium aminivorans]|uniref:Class I SAM-dependent methyltransferase n=1 Tax=Candidatus Mcinerneyibacterium aminivorans TaxID=2703815 RepID=A0A5D0MGJ1_9BACT|nr:MAG: hypothetical protein FXF47_08400 [Candidatus Mcinerneyibacterium aminivorans]